MNLSIESSNYLDNFLQSISVDLNSVASYKYPISLPQVPISFLMPFLNEMIEIFKQEPSLLDLDGEIVVIGDLHGHYLDFCRILKTFQLPINHKYLFLGDLVDKGDFSFEIIFIIFTLKYLYPDSVYLVRGNHEFEAICSSSGFLSEIIQLYKNKRIYSKFMDIFSYLPLGALVQRRILCIHGGICEEFTSVNQIRLIEKPVHHYDEYPFLIGIVWSDPKENCKSFLPNPRMAGQLFGEPQLDAFLLQNDLKFIIRGHQCVHNGVQEF
jgi:protein phosphatase